MSTDKKENVDEQKDGPLPEGEQKALEERLKMLPPLAQLRDKHGNLFYFGSAGDYWHPPFPVGVDYRTHVKKIRDMEIRDDDVLICSYPKTGLHWHTAMVAMLRNGTANHSEDPTEMKGFLDMVPVEVAGQLESPRLLVTHIPFRYLPRQAFEKKVKIIYLDRNPKDVLVSFYFHMHGHNYPLCYPGTFEQFFELSMEVGYIYGNIFDYLMEWQTGAEGYPETQVLTSMFEDVKMDPVRAVVRLNDYLGTGCSEDTCRDIAAACGFKNLKTFKDANQPEKVKAMFRKGATGFYRKGEIGDWKNHFTVAMSERFDQEFEKWMKDYKTKYIFSK